jgi:hypothetical protein
LATAFAPIVPPPDAVLGHDRLAEFLGQLLRDDAPGDVGRAARGEGDDGADRLGRPFLRGGEAGSQRQRRDERQGETMLASFHFRVSPLVES